MLKRNLYAHLPIMLLLFIGAVLRMYKPFDIPFMHDELSALSRLEFDNLRDLLENGVKIDGHPAGVQVFLYYWASLFGKSEFAVKFPFMMMGIASIWLCYRISLRFFASEMGALLVAVCMAALQFPVMYSQIARPYGSGLFLALWMVINWAKVLDIPRKSGNSQFSFSSVLQYAFATALCAYNHHFSLLFALIVGLSGLFFLKKGTHKAYLTACILAILLYLPHLSITLFQLSVKGLGWLRPPTPRFFLDFLHYIFQFSYWVEIVVLVLFLIGLFSRFGGFSNPAEPNEKPNSANKYRLLFIIWFITTPIIGYLYSVYRAPVLQFSMLIFGLPYFFIFLFSYFKDENFSPIFRYLFPSILLIVIVLSLIFERKHYEVFYHQPLESFRVEADAFRQKAGKPITAIFAGNPKYVAWYDKKYHRSKDYWMLDEGNLGNYQRMRSFLDSIPSPYVLTGNLSHDYTLLIQEKFPYMFPVFNGFTCDMWGFAKNRPDFYQKDSIFQSSYSFRDSKYWRKQSAHIVLDANQLAYCEVAKGEKSPICQIPLGDITDSRHFWIEFSGSFSEKSQAKWVFILKQKDTIIEQRTGDTAPFLQGNGIQKAYFTARLTDIFTYKIPKNLVLECFIENTSDAPIKLYDLSVNLRKSNPLVYGLIDPLN